SVFYLAFFLTVTPDAVLYTLSYTTLFRSVIVDAHTVHDIGSPGVTHPHQERLVVAAGCGAGSAEETGRGWRAADDHHAAVAALDGVVGGGEHLGVRLRADLPGGPFAVNILFVPDFNRLRPQRRDTTQKSCKLLVILGR